MTIESAVERAYAEHEKRAKADVNYSKGMASAHCSICRYYHNHTCERVVGQIDPTMWCKLFKPKSGG